MAKINLLKNDLINVVWISCLEKPSTITTLLRSWNMGSYTRSRYENNIKEAKKSGLIALAPEKERGVALYYQSILDNNYFKLIAEDPKYNDLIKDYFSEDKDLWLSLWNDKTIKEKLFSQYYVKILLRDSRIAGLDGFHLPILLSLLYTDSIALNLVKESLAFGDKFEIRGAGIMYDLQAKYDLPINLDQSAYRHILEDNGDGELIAKKLYTLGIGRTKLYKEAERTWKKKE
jgi:hypothetical protein